MSGDFATNDPATLANIDGPDKRAALTKMHISKRRAAAQPRAFSSEVDTGSRDENASKE
jgi:hypothetical protein